MRFIAVWALLAVMTAAAVSFDANAQSLTKSQELMPPVIQLDIAGRKMWLMPKNDVLHKLDNDQKRFVENFVKAMQTPSMVALKQLILPESLKCLDSAPKELREGALDSIIANPMQGDMYSLAFEPFVQKFDADFAQQMGHWNKAPVANTHTFLFGYYDKNAVSTAKNFRLIKRDSDYYIILDCPTEASVALLEDTKKQAQDYNKSLEKALAVLTQSERDTLTDLVEKGGEQEAVKRYEQMHPDYKQYARGVANYFKEKYLASIKEKAQESALKIRAEVEKTKQSNPLTDTTGAKTNTVAENTTAPSTEAEARDPYKLIKMASLLALIFVVAVLLLRVLRRDGSEQ